MSSAVALAPRIGITVACAGLGVSRATFYRSLQRRPVNASMVPRSRSPWALSLTERGIIRKLLHSAPYIDLSAHAVYARLLDAGRYLASVSTFYRILRADGEARPRLVRSACARPRGTCRVQMLRLILRSR